MPVSTWLTRLRSDDLSDPTGVHEAISVPSEQKDVVDVNQRASRSPTFPQKSEIRHGCRLSPRGQGLVELLIGNLTPAYLAGIIGGHAARVIGGLAVCSEGRYRWLNLHRVLDGLGGLALCQQHASKVYVAASRRGSSVIQSPGRGRRRCPAARTLAGSANLGSAAETIPGSVRSLNCAISTTMNSAGDVRSPWCSRNVRTLASPLRTSGRYSCSEPASRPPPDGDVERFGLRHALSALRQGSSQATRVKSTW
jgi:hypothetical protein